MGPRGPGWPGLAHGGCRGTAVRKPLQGSCQAWGTSPTEPPRAGTVPRPSSTAAGRGRSGALAGGARGHPGSPRASPGPPLQLRSSPRGLQGVHSPITPRCSLSPCRGGLLALPWGQAAGTGVCKTPSCRPGLPPAAPREGGTPLASTASTLLEQHAWHAAVEEQGHRQARPQLSRHRWDISTHGERGFARLLLFLTKSPPPNASVLPVTCRGHT